MKKRRIKRLLALLLALCLTLPLAPVTAQAEDAVQVTQLPIEQLEDMSMDLLNPDLRVEEPEPEYLDTDEVRVSIVLDKPSAVEAGYAPADAGSYRETLAADQAAVTQRINETLESDLDVVWNLTLAANLISAEVTYGQIAAIEAVPGVCAVYVEREYEPAVLPESSDVAYPTMVSAGEMTGVAGSWAEGYTGAGSRIAIIDTGIDEDHQSFDAGAFHYALEQNAKDKGLELEAYIKSLHLLTARDVAMVLDQLNMRDRMPEGTTAEDLYRNEKLPFAFNYVDQNLEITHDKDTQGGHGSHVAGIASANRYIPKGEGYVEYTEDAGVVGTAPDAQLLVMKVFGKNGGAYEADYMAAIEDALMLGCDTVNLSLGSQSAGFSRADEEYYNTILEKLKSAHVIVTIAAGNSYNFSYYSESPTKLLRTEDVNNNSVGSPGSYTNSLAVASVDNITLTDIAATFGNATIIVNEATSGIQNPWSSLDTSENGTGTAYSYLFLGNPNDPDDTVKYGVDESAYEGIDVEGKIVLISRGNASFADKHTVASQAGAAGVVVYNNESGNINISIEGSVATIPCVSISQSQAQRILAEGTSGTVTVQSGVSTVPVQSDYYTMSEFSSWGVPESLELKPEITAPGGNIYSVDGEHPETNRYITMSGTSMATPHMAGLAAGLMQYIDENELPKRTGMSTRALAQSLLMSTAEPVMEESTGLPYSVRKQGAGLANITNAISSPTYITVEGQEDGKVKFELGDDPTRTGVYTLRFQVSNMTDQPQSYLLDADILAPAVLEQDGVAYMSNSVYALNPTVTYSFENRPLDFTGDGLVDHADAKALMSHIIHHSEIQNPDQADLNGDQKVNEYDVHLLLAALAQSQNALTVPANGSVEVTATVTLSDTDRDYMESNFRNGTYVEGFLYLHADEEADGAIGISHSIPILGFYGNWTDASMFEKDVHVITGESGILETDAKDAYIPTNISNSVAIHRNNGLYYIGNPYIVDNEYREERNAINPLSGDYISLVQYVPIRNSAMIRTDYGFNDEWDSTSTPNNFVVESNQIPSVYYIPSQGGWYGRVTADIAALGATLNEAGDNGKVWTICTTLLSEYYLDEGGNANWEAEGNGARHYIRLTTDSQAPELLEARLETDPISGQKTMYVQVKDNRYVAAVFLLNPTIGTKKATVAVNQTELGATTDLSFDVSHVQGENLAIAVCDYAGNESYYALDANCFEPEPEKNLRAAVLVGGAWYGVDENGLKLEGITDYYPDPDEPSGSATNITAAEYIDGYVFYNVLRQDGNKMTDSALYVRKEKDYDNTTFIRYLSRRYVDFAYNRADGKLYALYSSNLQNHRAIASLYTIDILTGEEQFVCNTPAGLICLAADRDGYFYGIMAQSAMLYRFRLNGNTVTDVKVLTAIMDCANCSGIQSMTWDPNTGNLYWAVASVLGLTDQRLVEINLKTGKGAFVCWLEETGGLYVIAEGKSQLDPVDHADSVQLSHNTLTLKPAETFQLTASVYPWNASDRTVSWRSSDETIATVAPDGTVTALAAGTCTITAVSNLNPDLTASCAVTVAP